MKCAQEAVCAKIERVKREEAAHVAALKGEHKAEVRRLNELLEQSHLQNDHVAQLENQLIRERSEAAN